MRKLAAASAEERVKVDVVFMDPPRSGSSETFLDAVALLAPKRVVYISCDPHTLGRDLEYMRKHGYRPVECQPVDMFPYTDDIENVVLLERTGKRNESERKSGVAKSGNRGHQKELRKVRPAAGGRRPKTSKPQSGKRSH